MSGEEVLWIAPNLAGTGARPAKNQPKIARKAIELWDEKTGQISQWRLWSPKENQLN